MLGVATDSVVMTNPEVVLTIISSTSGLAVIVVTETAPSGDDSVVTEVTELIEVEVTYSGTVVIIVGATVSSSWFVLEEAAGVELVVTSGIVTSSMLTDSVLVVDDDASFLIF